MPGAGGQLAAGSLGLDFEFCPGSGSVSLSEQPQDEKMQALGSSRRPAPVLRAGSTLGGEMSGGEELMTAISQHG